MKLLFTRNLLGVIKLSANVCSAIKQVNLMTTLGGTTGEFKPRWPSTYHRNLLRLSDRCKNQFTFITSLGINQATRTFVFKHMIKTRLITGYTGINSVGLVALCFFDKTGIR